jgi:glutaredoxin
MHIPNRFLVLVALVGSALALACGPEGTQQSAAAGPGTPSDAPARAKPRDASLVSLDESDAMQIYYQFVDERGRVRFVSTLDDVPPDWRGRVGFVEMSSPPPGSPADAQRLREKRMARTASRPAARTQDEPADGGGSAEVIMYSADWCGVCTRAKRYMDGRGIAYDERNVDEERWAEEMNAKAGRGGIPVFDVGGQILRGFSPERLDQLIGS